MNLFKVTAFCAVFTSMVFVNISYAVDVVHMANGDRYRGEIIDRDTNGYVYFKTEYGALLQLYQDDIVKEIASNPKFAAVSEAPQSFVSVAEQNYAKASWQNLENFSLSDMQQPLTPAPIGQNPVLRAETKMASVSQIKKTEVAETTGTKAHTLWGYAYKGEMNFGGNIQSGNSDKTALKFDGKAELKKDKHRVVLGGEVKHAKDDGTITVNNKSFNAGYDYFFDPKWYWKNAVSVKTDEIKDLDLRFVLGSGLGYQIHESDDRNAKASLTLNYINERYDTAGDDETSIGGDWHFAYDQKLFENKVKFYHDHDLLFPFDALDGFVFDSTTGVKLPLAKGISSSFEFDFDWDNDPATGKTEEDATYSVKMGYEW